ncbi:MAG: xanthine dehydrogenase [Deltaproteobacteria bacterium]|nr:xanthine dehydrogenase [Deltaproteobacteria bacterium]
MIKSASDIGSAVAHLLKTEGLRPVLLEKPEPGATRRLMCYAGAAITGRAEMEGLTAQRCSGAGQALELSGRPGIIPLLALPQEEWKSPAEILGVPAGAVVDARMRKKIHPEVQIGEAPLVIGIGPGFTAGEQCHAVIESNWGDGLGRVITSGSSQDYTGKHRLVEGHGADRYIYSPHDGLFTTGLDVLARVEPGQEVARVDDTPLCSSIAGLLRGLAYPGQRVTRGAKVVEIDPKFAEESCRGIKERPAIIARGVLQALRDLPGAG